MTAPEQMLKPCPFCGGVADVTSYVAFPAKGRASPLSRTALSSASPIEPASGLDQRLQSHDADTPIIRAIDQLFANQGQRIAGLMGEK